MSRRSAISACETAAQGGAKVIAFALAPLICCALPAVATELHFDCARTDQTAKIDLDTDRRFLQILWSEAVAEEFADGQSYVSGPDSFGEKQKVTYVFEASRNVITFGTDRVCLQSGTNRKCADQSVRNTLDVATGELKYDEGDQIAILHCVPASRRGF
ncbi:MAG TPA: hypothetical protein VK446_07300 [Methylocystis sp.]|nr:hypothetical protein [Methylocystis sp.]